MHNSLFLSAIVACDHQCNLATLDDLRKGLCWLKESEGIEIELIFVSTSVRRMDEFERYLDLPLLPSQRVLLGQRVAFDDAALAGCSLANGDFTLIAGPEGGLNSRSMPRLLSAARRQQDFLIGIQRLKITSRVRERLLAGVITSTTGLSLNPGVLNSMMISRRGLNWALEYRSSAKYLPEIYLASAVRTDFVELDQPLTAVCRILTLERLWPLLARQTKLPIQILRLTLAVVSGVLMLFVVNAVSVTVRGQNLLNQPETQVPGWATIIVVLSAGFIATIYALLVLVRTHLALGRELRADPMAVIQSVTRR